MDILCNSQNQILPEAVSTFRHVGFFNHIKTDGAENKAKEKSERHLFNVKIWRKVLLIQSNHLKLCLGNNLLYVRWKDTPVQQQPSSIKIKRAINSSLNCEWYCSLLQLETSKCSLLSFLTPADNPNKARESSTSKAAAEPSNHLY